MIEKNQLRDRASGLPPVNEEMWNEVCEHNREMFDEFMDSKKHLSKQTLKQYTSGIKQFLWFIKVKLKNKCIYEIKKRDFIKYFSYLQDYNLSSSALKFKKSAVSTLCEYIENIVADEDDDYKGFRNFTKAITDIPVNKVYDKIAISPEEYKKCIDFLKEKEDYLGIAWLSMAYISGARKGELVQFKSEIATYKKAEGLTYYETHIVRGKGRSVDGKPIKYMFNDEAMEYSKLWVSKRGYDHEYLFTTKYGGEIHKMSTSWANDFCKNILSIICERRINPHLLRASAATRLLKEGKDFKSVSKLVLHHSSTEVTALYDLRDDNEAKNDIFN